MNIVLLSGGSGTRLWPLSNDVRSKQFLKIFKKADGTRESMIERTYRLIKDVDKNARIVVATSNSQVSQIKEAIGDNVSISIEPCRRDTFPAIALAVSYLKKLGAGCNETVIVAPVDSNVNDDYYNLFKKLEENSNKSKLTLIGIKPTYPSEKYGYIIPDQSNNILKRVSSFKEKPNEITAKKYINEGALWNSGVFCFKLSYFSDKVKSIYGSIEYDSLLSNYDKFKKISFDYAIVEKEIDINVIEYDGMWSDLGTWNTLTEAMSDFTSGNVIAEHCEKTHIINELSIPLICLGMRNSIIAATPDGILVSDKPASVGIKKYVPDARPMYEKRIWGEYKVLDYKVHKDNNNSLTKELIINKGQHISYQVHNHRSEVWIFTEGIGKLILDGKVINVKRGDTYVIDIGVKHAIIAINELHIIEVQIGDILIEEDIKRFDFDFDSI